MTTKAGGLIFGQRGQPDLPCSSSDTCIDYFEIRNDTTQLEKAGHRFCMCGRSSGRIAKVDANEAFVYFRSADSDLKKLSGRGFQLHVFATCGKHPASDVTKECIVTESGYDYEGQEFKKTKSGEQCMSWAGQNHYGELSMPDETLEAAGSACRNPNSNNQPWCYTDRSFQNFANCDNIPKCGNFEIIFSIFFNSQKFFIDFGRTS